LNDSQVYRVARKPDPWAPLDWAWASPHDGTFGNRYDDPQARYRVLYASSQKLGCFVETLARFRVDPALAAELAAIEGDDDFYPLGEVPLEWFSLRMIGVAKLNGTFAEVCSADWISRLQLRMTPHLASFGLMDFDASTIQSSSNREITQMVSRFVYESGADGIAYPSKYGHDLRNWAIFEPFKIQIEDPEPLTVEDAELVKCLTLLHLKIGL
jgi:RES domain-containing protein